MNQIGKLGWSGGNQVVTLPKGMALAAGAVAVRRVGRTLVLEPLDDTVQPEQRIPPGHYTAETLPPLSDGARKILEAVDAAAARAASAKAAVSAISVDAAPYAPVKVADDPLPGLAIED